MDENETKKAGAALRILVELMKGQGPVPARKLAATIGSSEAEALADLQYLEQRKLVNLHSLSGDPASASASATGIALYKNAKEHPDLPLPGFGSVSYNTITIHQMHGGGIQQAGAHSTHHQTITYNSKDLDDLRQAVEILAQRIDELNLDAAAKRKALAQVDTIKAQLSDEPNPTILKEAGRTLRNITEGTIAGFITTAATENWQLVLGVLRRLFN